MPSDSSPKTTLPSSEASPKPPAFRRFLTRAEALTLIGMLVTISSIYLVWMRYTESPSGALGAMFSQPIHVVRSGRVPSIMWPLTVCAMTAGAMLLFVPTAKNRLTLALVQGACGLACVDVALSRFALQPGVLVALVGGALLTLGATDRYASPLPQARAPQKTE